MVSVANRNQIGLAVNRGNTSALVMITDETYRIPGENLLNLKSLLSHLENKMTYNKFSAVNGNLNPALSSADYQKMAEKFAHLPGEDAQKAFETALKTAGKRATSESFSEYHSAKRAVWIRANAEKGGKLDKPDAKPGSPAVKVA